MYLRSLTGPVEVMYIFYGNPDLIRRCMEAWFNRLFRSHHPHHYRELGMDYLVSVHKAGYFMDRLYLSSFEVASGCDVVRTEFED
jgi:hypothetical protein